MRMAGKVREEEIMKEQRGKRRDGREETEREGEK